MQIILRISLFLLLLHPTFAQTPGQSSEQAVKAAKKERSFARHSSSIPSVAFSHDGKRLASAGRDRSLKIWDMQTFQPLRLASEYLISYDELTTITDQVGKKKAKDALPRMSWISGLTFTKDGRSIIGCGGDGILRVYETPSGKINHIIKPRDWPIISWDQSWDSSTMMFALMYRRPIFTDCLTA